MGAYRSCGHYNPPDGRSFSWIGATQCGYGLHVYPLPLSPALCQMTSAGGLGRSAFLPLSIGMTHKADFEGPSPFA